VLTPPPSEIPTTRLSARLMVLSLLSDPNTPLFASPDTIFITEEQLANVIDAAITFHNDINPTDNKSNVTQYGNFSSLLPSERTLDELINAARTLSRVPSLSPAPFLTVDHLISFLRSYQARARVPLAYVAPSPPFAVPLSPSSSTAMTVDETIPPSSVNSPSTPSSLSASIVTDPSILSPRPPPASLPSSSSSITPLPPRYLRGKSINGALSSKEFPLSPLANGGTMEIKSTTTSTATPKGGKGTKSGMEYHLKRVGTSRDGHRNHNGGGSSRRGVYESGSGFTISKRVSMTSPLPSSNSTKSSFTNGIVHPLSSMLTRAHSIEPSPPQSSSSRNTMDSVAARRTLKQRRIHKGSDESSDDANDSDGLQHDETATNPMTPHTPTRNTIALPHRQSSLSRITMNDEKEAEPNSLPTSPLASPNGSSHIRSYTSQDNRIGIKLKRFVSSNPDRSRALASPSPPTSSIRRPQSEMSLRSSRTFATKSSVPTSPTSHQQLQQSISGSTTGALNSNGSSSSDRRAEEEALTKVVEVPGDEHGRNERIYEAIYQLQVNGRFDKKGRRVNVVAPNNNHHNNGNDNNGASPSSSSAPSSSVAGASASTVFVVDDEEDNILRDADESGDSSSDYDEKSLALDRESDDERKRILVYDHDFVTRNADRRRRRQQRKRARVERRLARLQEKRM
jgi:hypothetical protein